MTEPTCRCGEPTAGTTLCRGCTRTLDVAIANIRAYYADLDNIRTRQTRYTAVAGKTSVGREQALPVDLRFTDTYGTERDLDGRLHEWGAGTELAWVTRNTIVGWTRIVLDHCPPLDRPIICTDPLCRRCQPLTAEAQFRRPPADNLVSCCHYLQRLLPRVVAARWAEEMLDELLNLERRLRRFVDRPADRWYAGPCTAGLRALAGAWICGAELYAVPGRETVTCRECESSYPVEQRRAWLLAAAEDRIETATTIARAIIVLGEYEAGEERLVKRINRWVQQSRLPVRGHADRQGRRRPMYRVGDVLDLATEDATRQTSGRRGRAS